MTCSLIQTSLNLLNSANDTQAFVRLKSLYLNTAFGWLRHPCCGGPRADGTCGWQLVAVLCQKWGRGGGALECEPSVFYSEEHLEAFGAQSRKRPVSPFMLNEVFLLLT